MGRKSPVLATPFIRANLKRKLAVIPLYSLRAPQNLHPSGANEVMLSQLTRCAQNLWARLSSAANQFFRRLTKPARPNLVTGTLADLPRSRAQLLADACVPCCGSN